MSRLAPLLMWILVTALLFVVTWFCWVRGAYTAVVMLGLIAILSAIWTEDEFHIYRRNRKRAPKVEPPTPIPDFPPQTKRGVR